MRKHTSFSGYLSALIALMILLAACSGGGGSPTPASTDEPSPTAEETTVVAMVPTEEPTSQASPIPGQRRGDVDTDGDGVFDDVDQCLTDGDYGYGIDEFGCPTDTDKDGFADHNDACPNEGDLVLGIDGVGCPILDSDNDGLTDDLDSCPFEGDAGFGIDGDGCPILDTDGDGITDDVDACYREGDIFGFGVYPDGCPIDDLDGDGYADNVDACPSATDMGFGMDSVGCPIGDADNDGVGDNVDACSSEGDLGYGVDVEGCPNPAPNPDPEPNGDGDNDGVLNIADACPGEGGIVDALGCPLDSDGDGVVDNVDACPAQGGIVDALGCPLDSDGDGVVDNADLCPTEGDLGNGIDGTGCQNPAPIADGDGDGIPDGADICPQYGNEGNGVDVNGCPLQPSDDYDSDGVPNSADACPREGNLGNGVTETGCPILQTGDDDGDGIPNNTDQCPNVGSALSGIGPDGCPRPDGDGDGVPDANDLCPQYGNQGSGVDGIGCPMQPELDQDNDGVPNSADQCPHQGSVGSGVDANGCPIPDADGDGVPDATDQCPNQGSVGSGIDANGCPIADDDGDGVPDSADQCLGQGASTAGVDANGCPIPDDDGDGVANTTDQCPDQGNLTVPPPGGSTPTFYPVNGLGCYADDDNDGVYNYQDYCPAIGDRGNGIDMGAFIGCPANDGDLDYILDNVDACPQQGNTGYGVDEIGCPYSINRLDPNGNQDFDPFLNKDDACPFLPNLGPGLDEFGCPIDQPAPDTDGDGRPDPIDACPSEGNIIVNDVLITVGANGCLPDSDNDGIKDYLDACPQSVGPVDPTGCPLIVAPPPMLAVNITATCEYGNPAEPVALFVVTNLTNVQITNGYVDHNGTADTLVIEPNTAQYVLIPPNESGFASIQLDGVANYAQVTDCLPAEPEVSTVPAISVSAQCVSDYNGEITVVLSGFDGYVANGFNPFADGIEFIYEITLNNGSQVAMNGVIYRDGTHVIPYLSENAWRGLEISFIYNTVNHYIGVASNETASIVLENCAPEHVEYSVNISQSCNAETGINTVTLTATNLISLGRAIAHAGHDNSDIRHYYQFIANGLAPLNEQYHVSEGAAVYEFNTNGKTDMVVSYANPAWVNVLAQRALGYTTETFLGEEFIITALDLCGNPETPIQPDPAVTILSIQCVGEYLGEIEIGFANFNNFIVNGQEPFLGGFDYFYGIRDANADLYLINDTVRYEDGTFIITFTAQLDWRGRTLYFDYQTAQSVVEGTVATTTHPVALPDCLPQLPPDFGIHVSQSCNPETGINTVTFTPINFASYQELFILANTDPSGAGLDQYMVGTNRGIQYFTITADPVTVDVDTNGATIAAVGYPDPDFINYYLRYIILGAENAGPQPTSMNPLVQIPIDTCGVPPEPVELGEVKALEPTFTCDNISQELVIDFGLLTPAELQTVLASFLQSSGGGISAETGLMMFAIVQGSFVPINYFIHSGEYNPNGSFIQSGIHSPLDSGDLTLRIPYNLLAGGNTFLTYIDFQPLLSYMLDVFEAQLKGENPDNIPQPDFNTVIVTVPLQDCNIPEVVAISGVCTVFNNDRVVMFDVTGFTSNLANYSVNTPNSFLLMGNPPIVAVYPDENGYASIRFGNTGFGEVTCEVEPEVTPEPETTPEAPSESANLQIAISEVCDTTTGIITISFTISGASDLLALLDGNLGNLTPLAYTINDTGYTPLQWQDGIQTAQYNSLSRAGTLQYTNPAYLNYMVNGILSNSALDNPPPQFVAYTLTPCSISTEFTIPQAPTPVLQSLTCETPGQLVLTIDFGDNEAYTKAVDLLLGEIFAVAESAVLGIDNLGVDVTTILDGLSLNYLSIDGFTDNLFLSILAVMSHTNPLALNNLSVDNPLLVAFSFGEATRNGTTVSISMSVYAPPPAGTPLYVSFTNPYVFLNGYLEYILPYAERIKDGDVDALVEMSNGMSAFMTNLTNLTLSPEGAITQLLSAELAGDCFPDNDVEVTPEPEVTEVPPTPQVNISTVCDDGMLTISVDWTAILGDLSFANIPLTYVLSLNPSYNAANMNDGALHIGSLTNDGSGIFRGSVAFLPIIVRNKDNIYLHYVDYPRLLTAITNSGGNMPNMTDYMSTVKLDLSGCDFANTPVPAVSITAECVSDYNGRISITFDDFEDYFLNEIELFDAGILFEGSVRLEDDSQIYATYPNATYPHGETVLTYATDETARGGVVVFRHVDVLAVLSLLENGQPGNYVYADYVVPNCLPDAPTALTVPVAPTFSVDSLTCADAGGLSVQITQGDVTTYGQQFDALLRQLVPEGTLPFTFFNVYNTLGGSNGVPIILSHTAPVNMAQFDTSIIWVGGSADGVTLSNGTQTFTVALSGALGVPSNTSFYITVLSAEKAGSYLNSLLQPLVDRYNNGETITLTDLANINPTGNQATLIEMATVAQQLDSQLVLDCLYANQPNLQISISQVCDTETGINTVSFTITGADAILSALQTANASTNLMMLGYSVGVQQGTLEFRDGVQTAEIDTTGMLIEQLNYTNPASINEIASMLLMQGGSTNAQAFISTPLTICRGDVDGVTIPQAPSLSVTGVTCPSLPQIEIALSFGDTQAYLTAVDALFAPLSNTGAQIISANDMFDNIVNSIALPAVVTHTIPLSVDMLGAPSLPPNALGASAGAIGTAQTVIINITQLPPANSTLYLTLVNPYRLYDVLVQSLAPLVGRINNGETVTIEEVEAVMSSFETLLNDHSAHYAALLESVAFDAGDCVGTLPEFSFSISESCNAETGINTITFTLGGTGALAELMPYLPVSINGFEYQLVIEDGAQTIEIDTNGLQALEVEYINPAYIQLSIINIMTGSSPEGENLPEEYLTAELSLCTTTGQITLPEPPAFSVDSITCEAAGVMSITYTNGDLGAYSVALNAILMQILPDNINFPSDFVSAFGSIGSVPIVITHTNPLSTTGFSTDNMVAISMSSTNLNAGTYTVSISLAAMGGIPGLPVGTIPDGAPVYLNMANPRQLGVLMNTVFQPLVDMYNNGETITEETLTDLFSNNSNMETLMSSLFYSQQLDQSLVDSCFASLEPNLQIEVTESCDAETGINTVSFNVTGASTITAVLGSNSGIPLLYILNGQQGTLALQDGVQTVTVDTNGLYLVTLQYLNPDYINETIEALLSGDSIPQPDVMSMMATRILSVCGDTGGGDGINIPEPPTPTITSLTCPTDNQLVVTINFGESEAYISAVESLLGVVIGSVGGGSMPIDLTSIVSSFGSIAGSIPVIISHTTPIDASALMSGGTPDNIVGISTSTPTSDGTSITYTISLIMPPPAGAPLYITFFNPYVMLENFVDGILPLIERLQNGETLTMTDIQNAFSSLMGGDMQAMLASMIVSQELSAELAGDCLDVFEPFSLSISEQCDYNTGVNTISVTMGGTSAFASFFGGQQLPFIINGTLYNLSFQEGTQTIEFDTTGLQSAQMVYVNPDYLNGMLLAMLSQQMPDSELPQTLIRDLTICVGSPTPEVTPTEEITPEVTPTEEITPVVTPTEEITPVVTPTEEITPDATPTEEITPDVTPTAEATPTQEVTPAPEITPVVTIEIPTLPTLPPLPTIDLPELPTPDDSTPFCGVTFEIGGQILIDLSGAGCGIQEERPVQNWTPIEIGGAVCLPEIIYHTDETGDWELFWASTNRAPENLSNGVGYIDLAPTRSPDGRWIAFSSNRDGNWEIYAATVDGSTVIRLTDNDSAVDFDPSWSPDGTKLVYESNVDGNWELRMINLLTGEKTRLTDHPAPDINPAWNFDGTRIAFQSSREDGLWQIYEYNFATGTITRLSDGSADDTNPQYRPDGSAILYQSVDSNGDSTLRIMEVQGNLLRDVPVMGLNSQHAIWSPDGMYIAYQALSEFGFSTLYVYDVATEVTRQITSNGNAFSPAWICDTTNLVFTSNVLGNNNLYVVNALPMDAEAVDLAIVEPAIGGDANQRDPQNSPAEEDASRGGNLPPK